MCLLRSTRQPFRPLVLVQLLVYTSDLRKSPGPILSPCLTPVCVSETKGELRSIRALSSRLRSATSTHTAVAWKSWKSCGLLSMSKGLHDVPQLFTDAPACFGRLASKPHVGSPNSQQTLRPTVKPNCQCRYGVQYMRKPVSKEELAPSNLTS